MTIMKKIINISSTEDTVDVIVGYNYYYEDEFEIYNINHDLFESAYNYLQNYQFEYTKFKNNNIEGNITLDENMMIYTSIPYDEGWKVLVDGKEVKTEKFADSLLMFKAGKGKHKIKNSLYSTITKTWINHFNHFYRNFTINKKSN